MAAVLDKKFEDPKKTYTPATIIIDSAIVYTDEERDFTWKPRNYKETFYGPTHIPSNAPMNFPSSPLSFNCGQISILINCLIPV